MKRIELLAPAGTMECVTTAFDFGADAVYVAGQSFGMRASAPNLTTDELCQTVTLAHRLGKRVYIAINALVHEDELEKLSSYLNDVASIGPDGIIFSDTAVAYVHRMLGMTVPLHLSTQVSTMNSAACAFWASLGVERIVLARETTLADIHKIRSKAPKLELEVFAHGAMCVAYSGRCLLSSVATGRSGNRGACAQPCRWEYEIREKGTELPWMTVQEDVSGAYILNSRDLMMLDHIPDLISAGVDSLKIEGRMKSAYYVASVVHAYRQAIDLYYERGCSAPPYLLEELCKSASRTYTTGFFYGAPEEAGTDITRDAIPRRYTFVARVIDTAEPGYILVEQRNKFSVGDTLEVLSPNLNGAHFTVRSIRTSDGVARRDAPHPQESLLLQCPLDLSGGELLRRLD